VRRGEDLEVVGCPGHHAFLAIESLGDMHDDEAEVSGSSALHGASSLFIGGHYGEGNNGSWQDPLLTARHMTDSGVQAAGTRPGRIAVSKPS
jgi:hypothetical protein